jgi:hypothetical protein
LIACKETGPDAPYLNAKFRLSKHHASDLSGNIQPKSVIAGLGFQAVKGQADPKKAGFG